MASSTGISTTSSASSPTQQAATQQVPWRFRGAANATFSGITALEFDRTCELLWLGDSYGNITSFCPAVVASGTSAAASDEVSWSTYSAFRPFLEGPCSHVQFLNNGQETLVAMASHSQLRVTKRGGTTIRHFDIPSTIQRRLLHFQADYKTGTMYMAGETPGIQCIGLETPDECATVDNVEGIASALRFGDDWLALGTSGGTLTLRNPATLEPMHSIKPFASRIAAISGQGNIVWAAACAERSANSTVVKVFDTRQLSEPLMVISGVQGGAPSCLKVYYDAAQRVERAFLVTTQGFHMLQVDAPSPIFTSVGIEGGSMTAGAMTANGIGAVLGNDKGYLLTMSNTCAGDAFSNLNHPVPPPQPKAHHDGHAWSQGANRGQMDSGFNYDFPEEDLCSSWPTEHYMILSAEAKMRQMNLRVAPGQPVVNAWGLTRADLYTTDPKDKVSLMIPNPYPYNDLLGDDPSRVQLLLQELRKSKRTVTRAKGDTNGLYAKQDEALQVCYGNTTQTAFQWASFNPTRDVVGIDNSLPESWVSPILQALYLCHAPHFPVRRAFVQHVCKKEYCIACEVSIIYANMMVIAASGGATAPIAQCAGLLRAMTQIPAFVEAQVFAPTRDRDHAVYKIHVAQKILLEQIDRDLRVAPEHRLTPYDGELDHLMVSYFGTEFQASRSSVEIPPRFYWEVPASAAKVDEGLQHLLKQLESHNGDQVQIKRLPPIILLLLNPEHGNLKPPASLKFSRPPKEEFNYLLQSNVLHLADDVDDTGLFVSHHQTGDRENFVLVNDYLVSAPQPEELLEAAIPATTTHSVVLTCYALDNFRTHRFKDVERPPNFYDVLGPLLLHDAFAAPLQRNVAAQSFVSSLHSLDEILPSDIVALDAEYVVLSWGNKRPDEPEWIRRQRKPHMSLARVSCVLSSRDGDERTIMDDYIHTTEEVLDYVTLYSGIHEGDLDPATSTKNLTALKATQFKLRALVDRGVSFVGHGLPQDFRVCNIAVPPSQVIDTLELFHRPGHRKLSLRFLAYLVLGERVQEDEHDSVEDARTSLRLYRKYEAATKLGVFEALMDHILQRGQETNWFVPGGGSASTTANTIASPTTTTADMVASPTTAADNAEEDVIASSLAALHLEDDLSQRLAEVLNDGDVEATEFLGDLNGNEDGRKSGDTSAHSGDDDEATETGSDDGERLILDETPLLGSI